MILFSVILLIFGCINSEKIEGVDSDDRKNMQFKITTKIGETDLNSAEHIIKSVRMIVFDGDKFDNSKFMNSLNITDGTVEVEIDLKAAENKSVFVIINEPPRLSNRLEQIRYSHELEGIEYSLADYFNSGGELVDAYSYEDNVYLPDFKYNSLPMSGKETISTLAQQNFTIKVGRALARVDIWLKGADSDLSLTTSSSIEYNMCDGGRLIDITGVALPTPKLNDKTLAAKSLNINTEFKRAFTIYTPERQSSGLERMEFTILGVYSNAGHSTQDLLTFSLNTNEKILRNNLYTVKATIAKSGEISFDYVVEPWDGKIIVVPPFE